MRQATAFDSFFPRVTMDSNWDGLWPRGAEIQMSGNPTVCQRTKSNGYLCSCAPGMTPNDPEQTV